MVVLGFVLFNAADLSQALSDMGGMFGFGNVPFVNTYSRSKIIVYVEPVGPYQLVDISPSTIALNFFSSVINGYCLPSGT